MAAEQPREEAVADGAQGTPESSGAAGEENSPQSPSAKDGWRKVPSRLERCCSCCCPCLPCAGGRSSRSAARFKTEEAPPEPDEEPTTLLAAAHRGTEERALALLRTARPEDLAATDAQGRSPLHHAARRGFLQFGRALFEWGEAPPEPPAEGEDSETVRLGSALGSSLSRASSETLRGLLRRVTTRPLVHWVDARDGEGATALHAAASGGRAEFCAWLLEQGRFTEVDRQDDKGQTALHHAAREGHGAACLALLDAVRPGRLGLSSWAFGPAAAKDADGRTALHAVAEGGSAEACQALLGHRRLAGLVRQADDGGWTPLHCAARAGNTEVCRVLLHSVSPMRGLLEVKDGEGRTALHLAAAADRPQTCVVLLDCYAAGHVGTGELGNFLRMAYFTIAADPAKEGTERQGANARDRQGRTALHLAARAGAASACQALVRHTAFDALAATDQRGRTAADIATGKARRLLKQAAVEMRAFQRDWC